MYISKDGDTIAFQGKWFQHLILKKDKNKIVSYIELL